MPRQTGCAIILFPIWMILSIFQLLSLYIVGERYAAVSATVFTFLHGFVWIRSGKKLHQQEGKNIVLLWGLIFVIIQSAIAYWFMYQAKLSDRNWDGSPCGKSSCTGEIGASTIPYFPGGMYSKMPKIFCPYRDCRYGDATAEVVKIIGYPAMSDDPLTPNTTAPPCVAGDTLCANLATTDPKNFKDKAYGLEGGFIRGAVVNTEVCPGIDTTAPNGVVTGRGKSVCAICTKYMYTYHGFLDIGVEDCLGLADNVFCALCVDLFNLSTTYRYSLAYSYIGNTIVNFLLVFFRQCIRK